MLTASSIISYLRAERESSVMGKLPADIYRQADDLIGKKLEMGKDTLSWNVDSVKETVETLKQVRERKVANHALSFLNIGTIPQNLLAHERELFDDIVSVIRASRERGISEAPAPPGCFDQSQEPFKPSEAAAAGTDRKTSRAEQDDENNENDRNNGRHQEKAAVQKPNESEPESPSVITEVMAPAEELPGGAVEAWFPSSPEAPPAGNYVKELSFAEMVSEIRAKDPYPMDGVTDSHVIWMYLSQGLIRQTSPGIFQWCKDTWTV